MLLLVTIGLEQADLAEFDRYESRVLALLPDHGGRLLWRLRARDAGSETHLLEFPSAQALAAFQADPRRAALASDWARTGAVAKLQEVAPVAAPLPPGVARL